MDGGRGIHDIDGRAWHRDRQTRKQQAHRQIIDYFNLREDIRLIIADVLRAPDEELLREQGLNIVENADVAIRFDATVERGRMGRKRRAAQATITRHGRPVLRYVMPAEEYRVGDNPAEAFARILSDAFSR